MAQSSDYVVKPGETLNGIANRAGVSRERIIEANDLKPPYPLRAGQKLAIPGASTTSEGMPAQRTIAARQSAGGSLAQAASYVVQPGDTLGSIALRAEIPRVLIAEANGLESAAALPTGKVLLIPTVIPQRDATPASGSTKPAAATRPAPSQFAWPLAGPVRRGFLARGAGDFHDGIDITARRGDAARAVATGKVIFARKDPDQFGNLVVVDHGDGWHSAYGSLDKITVKLDDNVGKGERVGLVGDTSITRKTELHFELRKSGQPVNPLEHLPKRP